MKYLKFFFNRLRDWLAHIIIISIPYLIVILLIVIMALFEEGYTLEDFGIDGSTLNPFDYCNLTDVDYTAILHDDPNGNANVEITEYITFDVHAATRSNTFKELWRELPEDIVDGMRVTYDVKSVTQILSDGQEIPYSETNKMYWEDSDYTPSSAYYWHHSTGTGKYPDNDESLLIYIPWTYREKMTFKIVYSMNNAALKYNDCSELYLSMYSGNAITKLKSYKAQILIPNDLMPSTYYAYTFGTANVRLPYTESDTENPGYHTFSLDLDKHDLKFNYHNRYIEFCLLAYGKDSHIFTKYARNNSYSNENVLDECIAENEYYETQNRKFNMYKSLLLVISLPLSLLIIRNAKQKYKKISFEYALCLYTPEIDYDYFREIPSDLDPIFASELVFMKDPFNENKEKKEEYAAVLLSLARKKYIKISKIYESKEWKPNNTLITIEPTQAIYPSEKPADFSDYIYKVSNKNTGEILETLTTSERLYLELLERHTNSYTDSISLSELQTKINNDYEFTNIFVNAMEKKPILECGIMQGYFQDKNYDIPKIELTISANRNLKLGLVLLFLVNICSYFTPMALGFGAYTILGIAYIWNYIYLSTKAANAVLFTQYGVDEQAKWIGLYNFLNSDTLMNEREVHELPLWEKYLIYATAFGISEKVIKAIKIHAIELNIDKSPILNSHCYIHANSFHRTSKAFGTSIHTSSRGGGFRGHSYGGGGRGGGGGGGGH